MHLTKPAGCAFQCIGAFLLLAGLGSILSKNLIGVLILLLGGWMFIRGRRKSEINANKKADRGNSTINLDARDKLRDLEYKMKEMEKKFPDELKKNSPT